MQKRIIDNNFILSSNYSATSSFIPSEQVRQANATEPDAAGGPVMPAVYGAASLRAAVFTTNHRGKPAAPTPPQASHSTAGKWQHGEGHGNVHWHIVCAQE